MNTFLAGSEQTFIGCELAFKPVSHRFQPMLSSEMTLRQSSCVARRSHNFKKLLVEFLAHVRLAEARKCPCDGKERDALVGELRKNLPGLDVRVQLAIEQIKDLVHEAPS